MTASAAPPPITEADLAAAELAEIRRRRVAVGIDATRLTDTATIEERNLVGLALSGGGIRSACVSLGVIQAFAREDRFSRFDYMSSVSGGGFIASCISSLTGTTPADAGTDTPVSGREFPLRLGIGEPEPPALSHLRTHSDYLAPGGLFGGLRLAAVLLRGVLLNVFLFLPWVLVAVAVTQIVYEVESRLGVEHVAEPITKIVLLLTVLLALTFPFATSLARKRFKWSDRNRYELLLAGSLAVSIVAVALVPFTHLMDFAVRNTWATLRTELEAKLAPSHPIVVWGAIVILIALWAALHSRYQWVSVVTSVVGRAVTWLLGPVLVVTSYVVLCTQFVHLPFVDLPYRAAHARAIVDSLVAGSIPRSLHDAVNARLEEEHGRLSSNPRLVRRLGERYFSIEDSIVRTGGAWSWLDRPPDGPHGTRARAVYPLLVHATGPDAINVRTVLRRYPEPRDFVVLGLLLIVVLINGRLVNVNFTSLHGFYRDRLSKTFMLRRAGGKVMSDDTLRVSDLNADGTTAPYHLINATLNVSASKNPAARGRRADFFLFTKHFTGSTCTGYCATPDVEAADSGLDLASVTAISAAAAGPTMGTVTIHSASGDMMLLDLRLGYWAPNPCHVAAGTGRYGMSGPGPSYLLREATGQMHERGRFGNVSDGGHIENLGVYQLLRRRCRLIVCVDAEADPSLHCDAVATLIRYARIDMGIVIDIDLGPVQNSTDGLSLSHWTVGRIHYGPTEAETGYLVYLKSSLTGDENEYIRAFRRTHPAFPQQSTANQFFDETRFEVYRALGDHIATTAMQSNSVAGGLLRSLRPDDAAGRA